MIEPFRSATRPATMRALRERVRGTRWPVGMVSDGGVPLSDMREVARHWLEDFDWLAREAEVMRLPHFKARLDGLDVHFVHVRSARADAMPVLLLHGWPGSFLEMLDMVPALSESFHVVVPSLPGFGYSDAPVDSGMSNERIARLMAQLMTALGHGRFAIHGGDVGAGVATWLALHHPERTAALHLNYIPGSYAPHVSGDMTPQETAFGRERDNWLDARGAYAHVQRTRPLTLSYGLNDSPMGLAAWMLEKFREWADPRHPIALDVILSHVMLYWTTGSIFSSVRLYLESAQTPLRFASGQRVRVPCGIARFPYEAPFPPRSWIERAYDVVHWSDMPMGGHFAALEAPNDLARDIVTFVRNAA